MIVWIDGALVPLADAHISPLDHGLTVGDGVFETLRVYDGVPFAWTRHYERLARSAGGLGLSVPDAFCSNTAMPVPAPLDNPTTTSSRPSPLTSPMSIELPR